MMIMYTSTLIMKGFIARYLPKVIVLVGIDKYEIKWITRWE